MLQLQRAINSSPNLDSYRYSQPRELLRYHRLKKVQTRPCYKSLKVGKQSEILPSYKYAKMNEGRNNYEMLRRLLRQPYKLPEKPYKSIEHGTNIEDIPIKIEEATIQKKSSRQIRYIYKSLVMRETNQSQKRNSHNNSYDSLDDKIQKLKKLKELNTFYLKVNQNGQFNPKGMILRKMIQKGLIKNKETIQNEPLPCSQRWTRESQVHLPCLQNSLERLQNIKVESFKGYRQHNFQGKKIHRARLNKSSSGKDKLNGWTITSFDGKTPQ